MSVENYLLTFYTESILLAFIACLTLFKFEMRSKLIRLIGLLYFIGFLCNLSGYLLAVYTRSLTNIPPSLYDFILIIITSSIYNIQTSGRFSKTFKSITILYILIGIINILFIHKESISSYNKLLGSFIIIGYSIFYFYRLMVELPTTEVQRLPMFWFNSAFLIYHAGTIFLFAFTSYLINVLKDNLLIYGSFHNIMSIVQHILVLIGLSYDFKSLKQAKAI